MHSSLLAQLPIVCFGTFNLYNLIIDYTAPAVAGKVIKKASAFYDAFSHMHAATSVPLFEITKRLDGVRIQTYCNDTPAGTIDLIPEFDHLTRSTSLVFDNMPPLWESVPKERFSKLQLHQLTDKANTLFENLNYASSKMLSSAIEAYGAMAKNNKEIFAFDLAIDSQGIEINSYFKGEVFSTLRLNADF